MELDANLCYRALKSRDARFDGRFFTGVVSTGIYCRPVCPAPTPLRKNVRFYAFAAAAEEAGFRPCRRCRPETSPGTPAWTGVSATVARALRLIENGALDEGSLEDLCDRLGVGSRHLRRLFHAHVGVSPQSVAQSRRAHRARLLIEETTLPFATVAFTSGFASVRRFNGTIKKIYKASPRELRDRKKSRIAESNVGTTVRLPYRPPFDRPWLLDYFQSRGTPGVESVEGDTYRRTFELNGEAGWIEVSPEPGHTVLRLTVHCGDCRVLLPVVQRVRRMFDLDADPAAIHEQLRRDFLLAPVIDRHAGLRVPGAWDMIECATRAVLAQQVSVAAATCLMGRLAEGLGRDFTELCPGAPPELTRLFPTADLLAAGDVGRFGIFRARARALESFAALLRDDPGRLHFATTLDEAVEYLTALPGVGPWTAHLVAMRGLAQPDAFPASDLGLLKGAAIGGERPTPRALTASAEQWRPWRSYAAMYLWKRSSELDATEKTRRGSTSARTKLGEAATPKHIAATSNRKRQRKEPQPCST